MRRSLCVDLLLLWFAVFPVAAQQNPQVTVQPTHPHDAQGMEVADSEKPCPQARRDEGPASDESAGNPATSTRKPVVNTTVEVKATDQSHPDALTPYHVTATEILSSAGTYGDFSRYVQQFPGVVFNSDQSDDILVRGGHPMENLFIVDGFEVPNLNHISAEGTTGGFASMIDTNTIENLDLHTGGYGARYPERLSSIVDIKTRELHGEKRHVEGDVGIVGAGALADLAFHGHDAFLVSAHRSLLNLFTQDIGLNGVPVYSNFLSSLHLNPGMEDRITALSLSGVDSIDVRPCPGDSKETNSIDTSYAGWRTTNGLSWQHIYSPHFFSLLSAVDSEQHESIYQLDQLLNFPKKVQQVDCARGVPLSGTPVYLEHTLDGTSAISYDMHFEASNRLTISGGTTFRAVHPSYTVAQPQGAQSPFSTDPARMDATSFTRRFVSGETGTYLESTFHPSAAWSISAGGRLETFSFGGHLTATPRLSTAYRFSDHFDLHAAFGRYAQLPPYVDLVSFPENGKLHPMVATHYVVGADLWETAAGRIGIEAYRKLYRDYPVSSELASLSMANMVDMLGQQFLWLPFVSRGTGRSEGVELFVQHRFATRFHGLATAAYARARYAGLDGVLRPGNFDYPVVVNGAGTYRAGRGFEVASRYEYSTGRPYTPFLVGESLAQDRPIYDLGQINRLRSPYYSRLDFQINKEFHLGEKALILYAGMENALNRQNFLAYLWEPRAMGAYQASGRLPVGELHQMPHFPNIGVRFVF